KEAGKPAAQPFTEGPGCRTADGFADGALEGPPCAAATEDLFVPVVIYNNTSGDRDAATRAAFGEPSWNNPVVRIMDAQGQTLAPRYASQWTGSSYGSLLVTALKAAGKPVPAYLSDHVAQLSASRDTAVFSMYCFWSGEVGLAGLPGVLETRPGFLAGREVVEVTFDRRKTSLSQLAKRASMSGVASGFVARDAAQATAVRGQIGGVVIDPGAVRHSDKDDKYQLKGHSWSTDGLEPAQATALNRAVVTAGEDPRQVLSPRQWARIAP
ncbi:MAG: hypothetical protein AB8H79_02710, partial [Myxococcota bacterium]